MKNKFYLTLFSILFFPSLLIGQSQNLSQQAEYIHTRTERIKEAIKNELKNQSNRIPEYPLQDYYFTPNTKFDSPTAFGFSSTDTTPPSDPSNLIVSTYSIFSVTVEFTASIDLESGIGYYVFGVGSSPDQADIRWWQSLGTNTITPPLSLANLGIAEGDTFYITIYAVNGDGLQSNHIATPPITMQWENYGDTSNNLIVQYANWGYDTDGVTVIAGWDSAQIQKMDSFISRMLPIIKEIYGAPSHSFAVTLVRNLYYSGSNIYFPGSNQIHKDDNFLPQLLTHELIHAFRDDVILSMDSNWNYHPRLSGFEEGFAQGVSYVCMNRYVQLYPNDTIVSSSSLWGSSMDWDYDFKNVSNITTEDFWSDYGGMLLYWERYELGAAAMRKLHLEDSNVFRNFNAAYYSYLNNNHAAFPTRNLIINLFSSVLPQAEGASISDWINKQRIFDCKIQPGRKIWVRTQHYPWWGDFLIFQRVQYYETFFNGSDWAYWDTVSGSWIYYNLNGSTGTGTVTDYSGSIIWQRSLQIDSVPGGFGSDEVNFTSDNDLDPWPGGDTSNYVLNMDSLGIYKLTLNFDTTSTTVYRVIGQVLQNTTGIFGGILNAKGGEIYIDHEGYPSEPSLPITNGAYWGTRQWASVPNPQTGGVDSKPGKINIRYVDSLGNEYETYRNIDWGSWSGNQAFLLDVNEMKLLTASVTKTIMDNTIQIYPNPSNGKFTIYNLHPSTDGYDLKIFDVVGKIVFEKTLNFKFETLNLDLPNGIYFLQIKNNAFTETKKLEVIK